MCSLSFSFPSQPPASHIKQCPNFQRMDTDFSTIDCAFNWIGWDNDGNNKAPKDGQLVTVADGDRAYLEKLAATGGKYMA